MENEKRFMELLQWISIRTGTRQYQYAFLSFSDHSWTEIVEHASCKSEEELQRYYMRFGEQMFLAYLLGTKDLHSENLISAGEYPVMIAVASGKAKSGADEWIWRDTAILSATGVIDMLLSVRKAFTLLVTSAF